VSNAKRIASRKASRSIASVRRRRIASAVTGTPSATISGWSMLWIHAGGVR
jgi:hypothetical protein